MTILQSKINPRSEEFQANQESMAKAVADLRDKVATIQQGGGPSYQERHIARGKLLPRERINRLLTTAPRSWKSASSPLTTSTMKKSPQQASSPAWAASPAPNA